MALRAGAARRDALRRYDIDVRAMRRQRDLAEEALVEQAESYTRQIALLRARMAPFERARDARGRIVGRA